MKQFISVPISFATPFLIYWMSGGNFERDFWLGLTMFFALFWRGVDRII